MRLTLALVVLALTIPMGAQAEHEPPQLPPPVADCIKIDPWNYPYVWTYPCETLSDPTSLLP